MERKREKERGEEGEQERKKGKEGGEEGEKREKEGMREREGERREGGRKERERTFQGWKCSYERPPHLLLLFGLGHHIRSVMSVQEGELGFSWLPRSYQGTKKEGPHTGSFLAQVRISGNGDSFKYLFYKRL